MLYTVDEREFHALMRDKEDIVQARTGFAAPLTAAIGGHWASILTTQATTILVYLIARTVSFGRAAEQIAVRDFTEGTKNSNDEFSWSPIPVSHNTLRKHIKSLCEGDLINIYSARSMLSGSESQPRMFEINCRKMLDVPLLEHGRDAFFAQIEAQIKAEKLEVSSKKLTFAPSLYG